MLSELFVDKFFISSLIALLAISTVTGALGSVMIWQKLSYLGDSISHSSLLGMALALIFHIHTAISIVFIAILFALLLAFHLDKLYSIDTVLNTITNVTLSLGLILMSLFPNSNTNILNSLFGDVLMLEKKDVIAIICISVLITLILFLRWKNWLIISINTDLAISEKINVVLVRLEFIITLAVFIAVASQLIGILLINAFLVIPAAAARLIAKNPIQMMVLATLISMLSGLIGMLLSIYFDTLSGASVILTSSVFLLLIYCFTKLRVL